MPNLMVALPNIGGALCSTPQRKKERKKDRKKKQDENIMVCPIT